VRDSVLAIFPTFTSQFEGALPFMYLDVLGLVTTGLGNLIDPITLALRLPWVTRTGAPATQDQITAEWAMVKGLQGMKFRGGGAFSSVTSLRLTDGGVRALVTYRLFQNEVVLKRRFVAWEQWPADAQLGTLSIAWAAGPAWVAPHFDMLARAGDWQPIAGPPGDANADVTCRGEAWLRDVGNPGLRPRNLANKVLFQNACAPTDPDLIT
jgi:hypothetical protein